MTVTEDPRTTEPIGDEAAPRCDRCGETYAAGGDGWDGKCPGCADAIARATPPET